MSRTSAYWATAHLFYKSPLWRQLSADCKARDRYTCQRCGKVARTRWERSRLDAHHVVPRPNVETATALDVLGNLTTLCDDCHREEHPHMTPLYESTCKHAPLFRASRLPRRRR